MATLDERVSRIEGINEALINRLNSIENRLNVQIQLTVAMWVTTMLAVLAVLAAVLIKN